MVAAQWQVAESGSAVLVGLVQTATSLPVLLLAVAGGWLGDVLDRRRVLLFTNALMLVVAVTLGGATLAGHGTPGVVLTGTALLGVGTAVQLPTWQAVLPALVGHQRISQAAALGGISINLARVVGPAVGGAGVALLGPGWVFLLNAATFLGMLTATARWRPAEAQPRSVGVRWTAGLAHAVSNGEFRGVLVRLLAYTLCASAVWALLPLVARQSLGATSGQYGVLLACAGAGAVLGAAVLPAVGSRRRRARAIPWSFALTGLTCASVLIWDAAGWALAVPALLLMGAGWLTVLTTLNARAHSTMPDHLRARGMAVHVMANHGGQAAGGLLWGALAAWFGPVASLAVAGVLLLGLAGGLAGPRRGR